MQGRCGRAVAGEALEAGRWVCATGGRRIEIRGRPQAWFCQTESSAFDTARTPDASTSCRAIDCAKSDDGHWRARSSRWSAGMPRTGKRTRAEGMRVGEALRVQQLTISAGASAAARGTRQAGALARRQLERYRSQYAPGHSGKCESTRARRRYVAAGTALRVALGYTNPVRADARWGTATAKQELLDVVVELHGLHEPGIPALRRTALKVTMKRASG